MNVFMRDMYAGLALFFSTYYIVAVNPDILASAGIPMSAALLGTLLSIIVGNISGAALTRTGLIIAPAVGVSAFFANYIEKTQLFWGLGMVACLVSGLAIILTSAATSWREKLIEGLPPAVRMGAKAAIGSLLVYKAFDIIAGAVSSGVGSHFAYIGTAGCIIMIISFSVLRDEMKRQQKDKGFLFVLMHTEYVLSVALFSCFIHLFQTEYLSSVGGYTELSWLWSHEMTQLLEINTTEFFLMIILASVVWLIIITDIPGTPPEVLPEDFANRDVAVKRGFINDGLFSFFSPFFGTTPTIYYAENLILRDSERYGWRVLCIPIIIYSVIFVSVLCGQFVENIEFDLGRILPPLAVAPIVLYVGVFVISYSFLGDQGSQVDEPGYRKPIYFFPAAVAVILTPRLGLEVSFPLAILSYWVTGQHRDSPPASAFTWLSFGAFGLLLIYFGVWLLPAE